MLDALFECYPVLFGSIFFCLVFLLYAFLYRLSAFGYHPLGTKKDFNFLVFVALVFFIAALVSAGSIIIPHVSIGFFGC